MVSREKASEQDSQSFLFLLIVNLARKHSPPLSFPPCIPFPIVES